MFRSEFSSFILFLSLHGRNFDLFASLEIKRAKNDYRAGGYWEFPGGKLEEGQDISQALEKEILEGTGLSITPINRIVYWESEILKMGKYTNLLYLIMIGLAQKKMV